MPPCSKTFAELSDVCAKEARQTGQFRQFRGHVALRCIVFIPTASEGRLFSYYAVMATIAELRKQFMILKERFYHGQAMGHRLMALMKPPSRVPSRREPRATSRAASESSMLRVIWS